MRKLFFSFLLALVVPMAAEAQEMYAVYDGNDTFTFYYDNEKESRSGEVYDLTLNEIGYPQWYQTNWKGNVAKTVFDASFAGARPTTTRDWFNGFWNMKAIEGIEYLNTSEVTNMHGMFWSCSSLTSLDLSHFETGNVTDMYGMFCDCRGLTSLDLSHIKTDNVTNMVFMFYDCRSLTSLDLNNFKTNNVKSMGDMFHYCSSLTSLDLSTFKTDNVTEMYSMFEGCSGLTSLDVTGFKTDNVTEMFNMFRDCSGLTNLDVSHFKTDKVKDMSHMFEGCSSLKNLDVSNFKNDNVWNLYCMFWGCSGLTSLDLSNFKNAMTEMGYMFGGCSGLTTIYCNDDWYADGRRSGEMFFGCTSLVGGAGTVYDEEKTDATMAHPDSADNPGYFTRKAGGSGEWAEGDLNHDGKVDATDVVWLTNRIMNQK